MADIAVLDVRLHDRSTGTLTRLVRGRIVFGFDPHYADDPERATLSLSFRDPFGGLATDIAPTRTWVHPFFSNLLPGQEHAMMRLAGLAGIEVPATRLVPAEEIEGVPRGLLSGTGQALAVRRFDRLDDGTRVHIEDFAQILGAHPERKYLRAGYREIAEVLGREIGDDSVTEFVRRLVFCVMIGNGDAHLKNWSVIYPDRRNPRLAPAYDLVSTIAYVDHDRMALEWFSCKRRFTDLSGDLLARLASGARLAQRPVVRAGR